MKVCPHCNFSCEDTDIVCKNCGYLFSVENNAYSAEKGNEQQPNQQQTYRQPESEYHPPVQSNYAQPGADNFQAVPDSGKTNGLAIAGMVLGIIGVVFSCCGVGVIAAIPGVILSIMAIIKIGKTGDRGKGMAIAGIICGGIGTLLGGYMVVSFIIAGQSPAFWDAMNKAIENAQKASSSSSLG